MDDQLKLDQVKLEMPILFYRPRNKYGCFSNFSKHSFELDGKKWMTSEHFFQASKYVQNPKYYEKIQRCESPNKAAILGRNKKVPLRTDWEEVKEDVMRRVLEAKFRAHKELANILVGTGDELLIENSPIDNYWGIGREKNGKNRLGVLIMELRKELQEEKWLEDTDLNIILNI